MRKLDFFRLQAPAAVPAHIGASNLKKSNFLIFSKVLRKAADQANFQWDWEAKRNHCLVFIYFLYWTSSIFYFGRSNCKITNPTVLLLFEKNFCHVKDIITPTTYTFLALSPIWQTKNIDFAKKIIIPTPTSRSFIYFLTHSRVEF